MLPGPRDGARQALSLGSSSVPFGGDYGMNNMHSMNNGLHNAGAYSNQPMNHGYNINGNNNGGNMNASINSGNYSGNNSNNIGGNGYQSSTGYYANQGLGFGLAGQGGQTSMQTPVAYFTPSQLKEHNDMRAELEAENEKLRRQLKECEAEKKQLVKDKEEAENMLKTNKDKSAETVVRLRNKIARLKEVITDVQYAQEQRALAHTR